MRTSLLTNRSQNWVGVSDVFSYYFIRHLISPLSFPLFYAPPLPHPPRFFIWCFGFLGFVDLSRRLGFLAPRFESSFSDLSPSFRL